MSPHSLDELFALVRQYPRIIVLGPQRSGTNFAADVLAEETDRPLFSERAFGETSCVIDIKAAENGTLDTFLFRESIYVLQAPTLTCGCHTLEVPDALVCYMDRPADEIEASRTKSDWPGAHKEWGKYAALHPRHTAEMRDRRLGDLQRHAWDAFQRERMRMPFVEVSFSLLTKHPRWVPPELRAHFKIGQTRLKP